MMTLLASYNAPSPTLARKREVRKFFGIHFAVRKAAVSRKEFFFLFFSFSFPINIYLFYFTAHPRN
jgi:hypothetical protein